ncbi:MAG: ABC transporter ATP-binding protein/permease [Defluviitaleaceae bacterium]|nr:ABC transporter ATP-binding protein/permease [Defluviitaleaceae bacterium]MCL2240841.1 ABC transporter ATP-binding protein/permease [Defluviitaleaceae bacterium]
MKMTGKTRATLIFAGVFGVISSALTVSIAFLLQRAVDAAGSGDLRSLIFVLALTTAVLTFDGMTSLIAVRLRRGYVRDMLLSAKAMRMNFLFFRRPKAPNENNTKDLSFFTADTEILETSYFSALTRLPMFISTFIFALVSLLWINWIVTLVAIAVSMLPMLASGFFAGGLSRRTKAYSESAETYVETVEECIDGRREIVAYDKQRVFLDRHHAQNNNIEHARLKKDVFEALAGIVPGFMGGMVQVVVMGLSCYFVITGRMTFGFMIAIVQLMNHVFNPIQQIIEAVNSMRSAKEILAKARETNPPEPEKTPVAGFSRVMEIKNLGLRYEEDAYVVQNLNLTFKKGGKYAVFAPSGYGKTSVARALALEFAAFDGAITLDGRDIRQVDIRDYHKILRYVRQDPYLFSDTALNNIAFFDTLPEKAEVERVLAITRVNEFLPDEEALARPISNTSGLSGGQKQRLVLARALLHKPKILVLDEITSGVDLETAKLILADVFADKELTCIAITHESDEGFQGLFDEIVHLKNSVDAI